jgi:hypothetical protein
MPEEKPEPSLSGLLKEVLDRQKTEEIPDDPAKYDAGYKAPIGRKL